MAPLAGPHQRAAQPIAGRMVAGERMAAGAGHRLERLVALVLVQRRYDAVDSLCNQIIRFGLRHDAD